ncbi:MAG: type II secretion system minor pseudopilin GspK [Halioglobus sp.]|jgi:general secretion pathway protein K|nr:general secretion pathway protein K [marine gamma proteobacterium HTCC2148]MDG1389307.1 type II secretion system minor pseudopilin GspK [Halioglobus sp.]MDG2327556.1 type II secretion system minor pseudopilin GspK [Halioglobus sp.]
MRYRHSSLPSNERGAALVMALLIFALSAALIVAMKSDFERVYQRGANVFLAEQSRAYLRGAEGLASLALLADYDVDKKADQARDSLDEVWAREEVPYPLDEGGWLSGKLEDLQGRFNLNHLAERAETGQGDNRLTAAQAQFVRLLMAVTQEQLAEGEAIAITQSIGDWLDTDAQPRLQGAEDDYYAGMTPPYRASNRPMLSVTELRAVKGLSPELFQLLEPWVTVWPQQPGVMNIHTAPAMVLRSIGADDSLRPLSEAEGLALESYRCQSGFADLEDFLNQPSLASSKDNMPKMRDLLGEQSEYFQLRARVEVAGRNQRLYSVLQRKNRQVSVLSRTTDGKISIPGSEREETCERSP